MGPPLVNVERLEHIAVGSSNKNSKYQLDTCTVCPSLQQSTYYAVNTIYHVPALHSISPKQVTSPPLHVVSD